MLVSGRKRIIPGNPENRSPKDSQGRKPSIAPSGLQICNDDVVSLGLSKVWKKTRRVAAWKIVQKFPSGFKKKDPSEPTQNEFKKTQSWKLMQHHFAQHIRIRHHRQDVKDSDTFVHWKIDLANTALFPTLL